ncbi:MAG: hypothetical protein K2X38_19640 [Gemmataceae bacterium]|nr:hypothetical protein [Gemmataceae bacterium]
MKKVMLMGLLAVGAMAVLLGTNQAALAPKYTIKEVMKKGFAGKGSLHAKVALGTATAEEKALFAELLVSLYEDPAPRGEQKSWEGKVEAIQKAAKDGNGKALQAAANCKACHDAHKGK